MLQNTVVEIASWFRLFAFRTCIATFFFRIASPAFAAIGSEIPVVWKVCVALCATFAASFAPTNSQLLCFCTAVSMFESFWVFVFVAHSALQRKLSRSAIHAQSWMCRVRLGDGFAKPTMFATRRAHHQSKSLVQPARCACACVLHEKITISKDSACAALFLMSFILRIVILTSGRVLCFHCLLTSGTLAPTSARDALLENVLGVRALRVERFGRKLQLAKATWPSPFSRSSTRAFPFCIKCIIFGLRCFFCVCLFLFYPPGRSIETG